MQLHCQNVVAVYQHGGVADRNLSQLGRTGIGAAIGEVGGIAAVRLIKCRHLYAVDIDNRRVVIVKLTEQLGHGTGILHLKGGAEEERRDIIAGSTIDILAQQHRGGKVHIGIACAKIGNAAVFRAEGRHYFGVLGVLFIKFGVPRLFAVFYFPFVKTVSDPVGHVFSERSFRESSRKVGSRHVVIAVFGLCVV